MEDLNGDQPKTPAIYNQSLFITILIASCLQYRSYKKKQNESSSPSSSPSATNRTPQFVAFQNLYLLVFLLAMLGDWLQGPYVYALYAFEYHYDQETIAYLFIVGFGASMVVGTVAGGLCDKFGRKTGALGFAVIYVISCITKFWPDLWILMIGRLAGGIATSLLFTVFEAWMVSEHAKNGFDEALVAETFERATFGNGIVAVLAGMIANPAAEKHGYTAPFAIAIVPLSLVGFIVLTKWNENYGNASMDVADSFYKGWNAVKTSPKMFNLGAAQACFEGAMYTFVFMWTPALATPDTESSTPFGLIFSVFMVCVMIGSSLFAMLMETRNLSEIPKIIHLAAAAACFVVSLMIQSKSIVYLAFLAFETTVGLFWPAYGTIRAKHIPEESRASVMNIFRIPLNAFVVLVLIKVKYMDVQTVFAICGICHSLGYYFYCQFLQHAESEDNSLPK